MKIFCLFIIALGVASARDYPLFKQCDSQWGSEELGPGPKTICKIGCLVSSVSMALYSYGIQLNGQDSNPGTLNSWLQQNGGFSAQLFVWGSVSKLGFDFQGKVPAVSAKEALDQGKVVILNVRDGQHWVLATSYDGDVFQVNDPGFNVSTYTTSDVTQASVFQVNNGYFSKAYNYIKNFFN
ncbi:peptidase C39 family protein (macronuclear) [Tetrahymena thermophila SB210]|uniref:Peptidase C39 family protein n=1 Tax=Tetrahymena thermophila (strain SB210) TaxID=312017 RepID=Q22AR6_TETTS|nr:peptidase C39 family protein [Tetrahymena thermophila SB210]EAR82369.3 peptidase C39 family protein [Tetrahymena thermophila SB210]|eukprot:XP_001030032.3 peptidase C39 family protein [Tetrahymena thermophila SB210]